MIPGRQFAGDQSPGARPYQEDYFSFSSSVHELDHRPLGLLMVLADGMGGHTGGQLASQTAVESFVQTFAESDDDEIDRLELSLEKANEALAAEIERDDSLEGMGCTLVAVAFTEDGIIWVSVGDSPLWLFRDGKLRRLNEDHSMAPIIAREVEKGELSMQDAASHPQRNALRSAIVGDSEIPLVDRRETPLRLRNGDKIILGSDGVETLSEEELVEILGSDLDAHRLCAQIVEAVDEKAKPGQDNATVLIAVPDAALDAAPSKSWSAT